MLRLGEADLAEPLAEPTEEELRAHYANSAEGLTAASHVVALNFQTEAAANNYWRK